jgi:hypothetical protein
MIIYRDIGGENIQAARKLLASENRGAGFISG